jgi:hypothetical protein
MRILFADSFFDAVRDLDTTDAHRALAFAEKLVVAPAASSLHPEIVHDAHDRTVRSFRVTKDMRAVAHVAGDDVTLLFVSRHDAAYAWARGHCVECIVRDCDVRVRLTRVGADGRLAARAFADSPACTAENRDELLALLGEQGFAYP